MQTLLDDIELDIQELKYLIQTITKDANPALRVVAKRNIQQMQARLDSLLKRLDEAPTVMSASASPILAERIKSGTDLRHAISLNDSFRFARELFAGDTTHMNEVVRQLGEASSLDKALALFATIAPPDEENEAAADFIELLKKHFS